MKLMVVILIGLFLVGCTSVEYLKPDGTKITYSRFITSVGSIEAKQGDASIKVVDSKPDAATIASVLSWLGTVMPPTGGVK
jgi:hypothetical protein